MANLWQPLFADGIRINFAHRTFRWDSEASLKAHVHVVVVGFSYVESKPKQLFENGQMKEADNINAYLIDAPDISYRNFFSECHQSSLIMLSVPYTL